jgi:predicted phosphodiesterase
MKDREQTKVAILADVHGNPIALDAVLRDIDERGGADEYWVLGDLAALGYDPAGALSRLASLPNARIVRGNTDRYVVTGDRPPDAPSPAAAQANPTHIPQLIDVEQSFAWAQGYLTAGGWLDWLAALPVEHRRTLPDGTRLLGVHASPGRDDGPGLGPTASDEELGARVGDCAADLVCAGHTHRAMDRRVRDARGGSVRVFNVGSVSNPGGPDRRASYALLEADATGYQIALHRVAYDWDAVVESLRRCRYPVGPAAWLIRRHFVTEAVP